MAKHIPDAELNLLRELAAEFALANPALAPLLDGRRTDPDVERLLESVAFKNSMVRRRLDIGLPDLIQQLAQLLLPHYLRPIPATTIIGFTPHSALPSAHCAPHCVTIPAGVQLASAPLDGTVCRFITTSDLELHPLELIDACVTQETGRACEIRLTLTLNDLPLSHWQPKKVRLFLADDHAMAAELYLLLSRHVTRIVLAPLGGGGVTLPSGCLTPAGFAPAEALLPYPGHAFPGYRLLQEYFSTPEKFLFLDLSGWEHWHSRGEGMQFSISFVLDSLPSRAPRIRRESFALHAVPAINLFSEDADPVSVNHGTGQYTIRPAGSNPAHCQVFSVDRVTGYVRATASERTYFAHELFRLSSAKDPSYQTRLIRSPLHGGHDVEIRVASPGECSSPDTETLSIALTCCNGSLPKNLCIGDIKKTLSALPDFVSARNISAINPGQPAPIGPELFQRLSAHLYLNHQSLGKVEHLRALLGLYVLPGHSSGSRNAANLKRIAGIEELEVATGEQTVSGMSMRGREIHLKLRQDHFAGPGDMFLFCCVLDRFLASYASLNSYTRLVCHETLRGGSCQWPIRLGNQNIS